MLGISRVDLRTAAVEVLVSARTAAGKRVHSPRAWPTRPDELPALMVTTPSERKESLGRSLPRFNSTITLAVMARVMGVGKDAPTMVAQAEESLELIASQVEEAVMGDPRLVSIVQQFTFVETHMMVSSESERIIGEASIIFGCEVFQEFQPGPGDPLTEIVTTIPADDGPGVSFDTFLPQ